MGLARLTQAAPLAPATARRPAVWAGLALLAAVGWSYATTFERMALRWSQDPQYSHGYIVPVLALIVLWFRRGDFPAGRAAPSWLGVPLLLAGAALRVAGALFAFDWLEAGSLLFTLAGACCALLGPAVLRWAWPVGALLLFALPWPWQFDNLLTYPLRRIATLASTYSLQVVGLPALARGNIIVIDELEVGVVEACSGLGMLMTFFALSTAVALVIDRTNFDRWVIFLSAVPIGVAMNVMRITVTVALYVVADAEVAQVVFHDVAGWVMMPLALATLWLELLVLDRLWLPDEPTGPVPLTADAAPPARPLRPIGPAVPAPQSRPETAATVAAGQSL